MGQQMIRVMIADDHQLFAEGLSQALNGLPDARVVGVAASGPELRELLNNQPAEVCVVDIEMPGGDGIQAINEIGARAKAIVVSMHASDEQRERARRAGAKGFFSKGVPLTTLAAAIRWPPVSLMSLTEESDDLLGGYRRRLDPRRVVDVEEREILQQLALGMSATEN